LWQITLIENNQFSKHGLNEQVVIAVRCDFGPNASPGLVIGYLHYELSFKLSVKGYPDLEVKISIRFDVLSSLGLKPASTKTETRPVGSPTFRSHKEEDFGYLGFREAHTLAQRLHETAPNLERFAQVSWLVSNDTEQPCPKPPVLLIGSILGDTIPPGKSKVTNQYLVEYLVKSQSKAQASSASQKPKEPTEIDRPDPYAPYQGVLSIFIEAAERRNHGAHAA
jgi:hypothetical protein